MPLPCRKPLVAGDGNGGLTKIGVGNLTLSAANSYSGGTVVNAGTLTVGASSALSSGAVTINSAMVNVAAGAGQYNWYTSVSSTRINAGGVLSLAGGFYASAQSHSGRRQPGRQQPRRYLRHVGLQSLGWNHRADQRHRGRRLDHQRAEFRCRLGQRPHVQRRCRLDARRHRHHRRQPGARGLRRHQGGRRPDDALQCQRLHPAPHRSTQARSN